MREIGNTPTRLPEPPRSVHGGMGCSIWFQRLFILPHTCVGVYLLGTVLLTILVTLAGTETKAIVTHAETKARSKGGFYYSLNYQFEGGGRQWTNTETVSATTYATVASPHQKEGPAGQLTVRYLVLGPMHYHVLIERNSFWRKMGGIFFAALFWNGIVSIFLYILWIAPIRQRLLLKDGEVARGTVLGKRITTGKSTTCYVKFRFKNPETGEEIEREVTAASGPAFAAAKAGDPVTIIYSPRKPRRATVYEMSGYTVEGAFET